MVILFPGVVGWSWEWGSDPGILNVILGHPHSLPGYKYLIFSFFLPLPSSFFNHLPSPSSIFYFELPSSSLNFELASIFSKFQGSWNFLFFPFELASKFHFEITSCIHASGHLNKSIMSILLGTLITCSHQLSSTLINTQSQLASTTSKYVDNHHSPFFTNPSELCMPSSFYMTSRDLFPH